MLFKLTVRAVSCIPCRLYSGGRPPAPLGGRILTHPEDIFQHNMWDHVQWTEEEREKARRKAEENSKEKIPLEEQSKYDREAHKYWDRFYETHQSKFFRNRNWLFTEFPELLPQDTAGMCIPEQGQSSGLDSCSESGNGEKHQPCGSSTLTSDVDTFPGQHAAFRILEVGCGAGNSVFPIISSIRAQGVVESLAGHLKQGGIVLFRDYGRYDLSQLRFKKGQCLSENFYTRQDGTCVYFFTKDEVHHLFSNAGLEEIQNLEDRRLQVNRGKKVVMHRVWMQSKYRKPYLISASV
ncbi:Methyltransferase-like protein [Anabarilius grahami]|uniref:tRNA N(3)-cytidine methyltransferase n=1 Tax=Anabarilius grahami TaxID=495550 RepID=A0A3N0XGI7_ANAGA|nr:Methyltransferase-like protein [Anabarilius grahami]